jgi:hypothetical protein
MTLKRNHMDAGRRHAPPVHTPRLRLKPKAPQSGYVDGAWWPHSEDLTAELPDLLSVLSAQTHWRPARSGACHVDAVGRKGASPRRHPGSRKSAE